LLRARWYVPPASASRPHHILTVLDLFNGVYHYAFAACIREKSGGGEAFQKVCQRSKYSSIQPLSITGLYMMIFNQMGISLKLITCGEYVICLSDLARFSPPSTPPPQNRAHECLEDILTSGRMVVISIH
jgi:hypothetical protein